MVFSDTIFTVGGLLGSRFFCTLGPCLTFYALFRTRQLMSLSAFEDEDEEISVQKTESPGNGQGEEKREQ